MFESTIKTYKFDNGELQRVQAVTADSFDELNFMMLKGSKDSFRRIVELYRNYLVPKYPILFCKLILFFCPDELKSMKIPFDASLGTMSEDAKLSLYLGRNVKVGSKGLIYRSAAAKEICDRLSACGCLEVVCGKRPGTKILPVGNCLGYLSENEKDAKVKVNANFFTMDCFDVATEFERIGTPLGLIVKDGVVLNPPLFDREALLVRRDGSVEVRAVRLSEMEFEIGGERFGVSGAGAKAGEVACDCDGDGERNSICKKAGVIERPGSLKARVDAETMLVVVVGCKVEAVITKGSVDIPSSGFVLKVSKACKVSVGDDVVIRGLEDIKFGIQVGNSFVVDGKPTLGFTSKFYNVFKHFGIGAYPPSLYPLNYEKARAPRIGIGATKDGKPVILWAEGPKKTGYVAGEQSRGASLSDMAGYAADFNIYNGVNLDGGGSAQILVEGKRSLIISDRNPADDSDAERTVPAGIYIK